MRKFCNSEIARLADLIEFSDAIVSSSQSATMLDPKKRRMVNDQVKLLERRAGLERLVKLPVDEQKEIAELSLKEMRRMRHERSVAIKYRKRLAQERLEEKELAEELALA